MLDKRIVRVCALLAVTAAALAGCSSTAASSPKAGGGGGQVTIALGADPSGLDPQAYEDGNAVAVYDNIAEQLIFTDAKTNALEPGLATAWKYMDDHTLRLTLRPNVKFSNGEPFNADSVVYSVKRVTSPNYKTQQSSFFGGINDARRIDDLTVDILSSKPDATMAQSLTLMFIVPPKYTKDHGDQYFNAQPVGTGPYLFVNWTRGSSITLKANDTYWGGAPKIKNVKFAIMAESNVQLNALKTGQIQLATTLSPQTLSQAPQSFTVPGPDHPMIILNQRGGPFVDKNVRLAANYAVDRQAIVDKIYQGTADVAGCQPFGPQTLGFNPTLQNYTYDPQKARELLAASGNPTPSVTFIGEAGRWTNDLAAEQAVQGYLQAVGFKVKFQSLAFESFLQQLLPSGNNPSMARPDMLFTSTSDTTGDADQKLQTFYAAKASAGSLNDPVIFNLVAQQATITDRAQRTKVQQEVLARACSEADFIYLAANKNIYGAAKNLTWQPRYDTQILAKTMTLS